jgi:peptide/nickel transport system substrate-binding protein
MCKKITAILFLMLLIVGLTRAPDVLSASKQKLVVAVGQEPLAVDPSLVTGGGSWMTVENWAEFIMDRTSNGDLRPCLATSWKVSPDGREVDFSLRKGVKFHSGDLMTTKDVAFSFERAMAKNAAIKTALRSMERLEVIDDYRFKIYFKAPDVLFLPQRGAVPIVSKSYYDRVGEDKSVISPVSTGSYKVVRYVPGEYVDLERFEEYWGEKPSVREARLLFVPEDTTRIAKLKAGEVDLITTCPYPTVKDLEKSQDLKVVRLPIDHPTLSVAFSTRNPKVPWHDRRVRLALAYAIDWKAIVDNVLYGLPDHLAFLAPWELGYDPEIKPYTYDPKKARELLAEAGYPKGFNLTLYWHIVGRPPLMRETGEIVASYFEAIGIRTKLIGEEYLQGQARWRKSSDPDVEYVGLLPVGRSGAPEPSYYLDLFFGSRGGMSIYSNPELDKLVNEARATVDDAKRAELIKKGVSIIHEDVAMIPIYNTVDFYAMKKNIDFRPPQKYNQNLMRVKDIVMR